MSDPLESMAAQPAPETALDVARRLGEVNAEPLELLERLVEVFGVGFAQVVLDETAAVEARGGMLVPSGKRRRTPGGVFFELVKRRVERWRCAAYAHEARFGQHRSHGGGAPAETGPPFKWADRLSLFSEARTQKGQATVKMTLTGKPGSVVKRGAFVVLTLESRKAPSLPKGLPVPPASATPFVVFVTAKQWRKVEVSVQSPEDVLVIEGFPMLDAEAKSIVVFATNTTTKLLQQAERQKRSVPSAPE